jgi:hypothetical protein
MEQVSKVVAAVGINYAVHYASMIAYNRVCMPHSLDEILQSFFVTASPACTTLLTIGQHTQTAYAGIVATTLANLIIGGLKLI